MVYVEKECGTRDIDREGGKTEEVVQMNTFVGKFEVKNI